MAAKESIASKKTSAVPRRRNFAGASMVTAWALDLGMRVAVARIREVAKIEDLKERETALRPLLRIANIPPFAAPWIAKALPEIVRTLSNLDKSAPKSNPKRSQSRTPSEKPFTGSLEVQTLLFSRKTGGPTGTRSGWTKTTAQVWAEEHHFESANTAIELTDDYVRIRQRDPEDYSKGTFRTIAFSSGKGIKAVVGVPKFATGRRRVKVAVSAGNVPAVSARQNPLSSGQLAAGLAILGTAGGFVYADHVKHGDKGTKGRKAARASNPATVRSRKNPVATSTALALGAGAFVAGAVFGESQRPSVQLRAKAQDVIGRVKGRVRSIISGPRRGDAPTSKRTTGTWAEHTSHGVTDYTRWYVGKKYTIYPKKPGEVYFTVEDEFGDLVGDEQVLPSGAAALALFSKMTGVPAGQLAGAKKNPAPAVAPPADVARMAARGLELRRQFGRGGTAVGVARARDLSNRRSLPESTLRRMASYFARHAVDANAKGSSDRGYWADDKNPSAGWIAWLLWGGDPGRAWVDQQLGGLSKPGRSK